MYEIDALRRYSLFSKNGPTSNETLIAGILLIYGVIIEEIETFVSEFE